MEEDKMMRVTEKISEYKRNQQSLRKSRQMRSESIAGLPFLRNAPLSVQDEYAPYIKISNLHDVDIQTHGKVIFQHSINFLRILAVKRLYPTGDLTSKFIARIVQGNVVAVQCISEYYTTTPPHKQQLVDFAEHLKVKDKFQSDNVMDYYFQKKAQNLNSETRIDEIAKVISSQNQIDLLTDPTMIYIVNNQIITNQELFESLHKSNKCFVEENDLLLWILLARFVNSHEAVQNIDLLPDWLNDYVKYDGAKVVPDQFIQICNCDEPLQQLRICLGMYPVKFEFFFDEKKLSSIIPQQIYKVLQTMPIWYYSHIMQLAFIAMEFTIEENLKTDGVYINCPPTKEGIIKLYKKYE